ncbi:MAG TPA: PrsW family glutamic-type intramembrane protease [Actinocrinis sp.]|nr:PrsW family glutamic-type intramembrane protease [Actinocrinis sp.]
MPTQQQPQAQYPPQYQAGYQQGYPQQPQYQQQGPSPGGYPAYGTEHTTGFQPQQPYYPNPWGFVPPPVRVQSAPNPLQLVPIHLWFKDHSLRNWLTILFVFLVITPTIALYIQGAYPNLVVQTAWVFAVYFAGLWLVILWVTVRPPMVRPWMLAEIAGIGLVLETPIAVWMEEKLSTPSNGIFAMIFSVGFPEEIVKALPVLVLAGLHRKQWTSLLPKDYLFLGAVSGLAFGASEAVLYTTQAMPADAGAFAQQGASPAQIAYQAIFEGAWRLLTDPISHAIWAGIAGYFIGLAIRYARGRVFVAVFGLSLVAVLHGINDRLAENGDWGWIIEVALSVVLFIGYVQAGGVVEHELEGAMPVGPPGDPGALAAGSTGAMAVPVGLAGPGGTAVQPVAAYGQAPAPGYGGWAPVPGTGYVAVVTAPAYAPPAFNPADGWGSTGFTQLPGARKAALAASDAALSRSQARTYLPPQPPGLAASQSQDRLPPQQAQAQPTQYQAQYPAQPPQYPQQPPAPQTPQGPPPPSDSQERRTY